MGQFFTQLFCYLRIGAINLMHSSITILERHINQNLIRSCIMEELVGRSLLADPGIVVAAKDALQDKELILLYFSASW
jgi:hypothetical protein